MTDKNRDFSQIRVGTVVSFDAYHHEHFDDMHLPFEIYQGNVTDDSITISYSPLSRLSVDHQLSVDRQLWAELGGYIVSQPEEQESAEQTICPDCTGAGGDNNIYVCATCNGTGGVWESEESGDIQCPTCADQASVRAREDQPWDGVPENPQEDGFHWLQQKGGGKLMPFEWDANEEYWLIDTDDGYPDRMAKLFTYHGPNLPPEAQAEKRGDAAGYARRVAEETEVITYDEAFRRKVEDRVAPSLMGRMLKISKLISWAQNIHDQWGDTCVYACDLSWGAVALNRESDDRKRLLPEGSTWVDEPDFEGSSQPDTQAETIAELRLSEMHARADAEAAKAKVATLRAALETTCKALGRVETERMVSYKAGNGRDCYIQADDGERCNILHSDITFECKGAFDDAQKALASTGDE